MSIIVFCLSPTNRYVQCREFADDEMSQALEKCRELRAEGYHHVTVSSEPDGQVGTKDAGGAVVDGKLPDGTDYEWSKAHRAGARAQKEVIKK